MTNAQFEEAQKLSDQISRVRFVLDLFDGDLPTSRLLEIIPERLEDEDGSLILDFMRTHFLAKRDALEERFKAL